jgi:hypothetical protein
MAQKRSSRLEEHICAFVGHHTTNEAASEGSRKILRSYSVKTARVDCILGEMYAF